ncbi:MAG: ComF family protein [Thermodesulfovibrionales bacterium]|nr:ComF family protein [Thermodesulfovibrionales bacterium]
MIKTLLNHLFPDKCPVCSERSDKDEINPFCSACWNEISPYNGYRCDICGIPIESIHTSICGECLQKTPFYDKIFYYGLYEKVLKEVIHLLKYQSISRLSKVVAHLVSSVEIPQGIDIVTPVPLHKMRLLVRGFNQSANIAYHFSRIKAIQFKVDILKKTVNTPPQTTMQRDERLKNMKGKFSVAKDVKDKVILLFDDVVTTSATVNECAKVLKIAGARKVYVVAVARSFWT